MDNRDARRRHALRGALIHLNTHHKHAHGGKKQTDTDALGGVKKAKLPPKAIPCFHGFAVMLRIRAEGGGRAS